MTASLSTLEIARLTRQIDLPEIGLAGQQQLKNATVAISRVGGVGGTVAAALARAGIGHLIIVHGGKVDAQYLNRWQLATAADQDQVTVDVFGKHLRQINPTMQITSYHENISPARAPILLASADVIVDGAPLFEERYAINAAAIAQRTPLVSGAMYGHEGYVTTIIAGQTPCLACLYPHKPDYWVDHQVFPVLGACPGMIGSLMAMEVIKLIVGFGQLLTRRLWHMNLLTYDMNLLTVERNRHCTVCATVEEIP
ncbi:MAG: HesA/MoeB/ThiF family protein [Legionellales bacterium]|nr:HesA/MoeB/ThiF family protein [Legionellales bacterium]